MSLFQKAAHLPQTTVKYATLHCTQSFTHERPEDFAPTWRLEGIDCYEDMCPFAFRNEIRKCSPM